MRSDRRLPKGTCFFSRRLLTARVTHFFTASYLCLPSCFAQKLLKYSTLVASSGAKEMGSRQELDRQPPAWHARSEVHKYGHMTTGHSVEA